MLLSTRGRHRHLIECEAAGRHWLAVLLVCTVPVGLW